MMTGHDTASIDSRSFLAFFFYLFSIVSTFISAKSEGWISNTRYLLKWLKGMKAGHPMYLALNLQTI